MMAMRPLPLKEDYWDAFSITTEDVDFLYNYLLEKEVPQTQDELARALIVERIEKERQHLKESNQSDNTIYLPKDDYSVGQSLLFPSFDWAKAKIVSTRDGNNPENAPFKVIEVEFDSGDHKQFAACLENHRLNTVNYYADLENELFNLDFVLHQYGEGITSTLYSSFESNPDLVRIAGKWFPRTLLVDVNIGYLNLAEALLEMEGGGPLTTQAILEQIELPTDVNLKLTEFSLNLALQEDGRFDEVGPSGEILWYLKRLEPDGVRNIPSFLKLSSPNHYSTDNLEAMIKMLEGNVIDELEAHPGRFDQANEVSIPLIYPHWRAGTLPIACQLIKLFPTALESPRVQFTFVDGNSGAKFPGWVVISSKYVYGLSEWYRSQDVFPGSIIHVSRGNVPGEIVVKVDKKKSNRDWVRTALVGNDGEVVFALLKQAVATSYDERMAIAVSDPEAIDKLWDQSSRNRHPLEQIALRMMKELAKLNPQGHVHTLELYAAVNIVRRCPPGPLLSILIDQPWATYLGDLYFRLDDSYQEK